MGCEGCVGCEPKTFFGVTFAVPPDWTFIMRGLYSIYNTYLIVNVDELSIKCSFLKVSQEAWHSG